MFSQDLRPLGFDHVVELQGERIEEFVIGGAPLIFLFDEAHRFKAGVRESLANACHLCDARIVDFIGVEGYPTESTIE